MAQATIQPPIQPCTSSELLNYVEELNGKQAYAYKRLAKDIARSSYTIHYYPDSRTFDMFIDIIDKWREMSRKKFLAQHGDGENIWYLLMIPASEIV